MSIYFSLSLREHEQIWQNWKHSHLIFCARRAIPFMQFHKPNSMKSMRRVHLDCVSNKAKWKIHIHKSPNGSNEFLWLQTQCGSLMRLWRACHISELNMRLTWQRIRFDHLIKRMVWVNDQEKWKRIRVVEKMWNKNVCSKQRIHSWSKWNLNWFGGNKCGKNATTEYRNGDEAHRFS